MAVSVMSETLGHEVWKLRYNSGLTQADLAAALGVCDVRISHIERGVYEPSITTMDRIAQVFSVRFIIPIRTGRDVFDLRRERRWTQRELGEKLGITPTAAGAYETNDSEMRISTVRRLCDAFGIPFEARFTR